jgi:Flp pilus assembly pilin Flp
MRALARRLIRDEHGQDLVEYALLTAFVGFFSLAAVSLLLTAIGSAYGSQVTSVNSIWSAPAPTGGGS